MISFAIPAHPRRAAWADALAAELEPAGHVQVFMDDQRLGEWRNHRRAIAQASRVPGASHVVVVQDDAILIPGFAAALAETLERKPDDLIGLYVGTSMPRVFDVARAAKEANEQGASWLVCNTLLWGVSTVFPVALIPAMLKGCDRGPLAAHDKAIGRWAISVGRPVYYTWPSLVDHRDEPSVIAGRPPTLHDGEARVAHRVGAPAWGGPTVKIERLAL